MFATTEMIGVTGLLSIEIHGGTDTAKTLHPRDDYVPVMVSKPSMFAKLTDGFGLLNEKLNSLLIQSQKLLSDKNIDTFGTILDNTESITKKAATVEEHTISVLDESDKTLKELRMRMQSITRDIHQAQQDFGEMKTASTATINSLLQSSKEFRHLTRKIEKSLDRGDYSLKKILEPAVIDVQILAKELSQMSRTFEQNPGSLLFKSRKPRRGPGE